MSHINIHGCSFKLTPLLWPTVVNIIQKIGDGIYYHGIVHLAACMYFQHYIILILVMNLASPSCLESFFLRSCIYAGLYVNSFPSGLFWLVKSKPYHNTRFKYKQFIKFDETVSR